MRAFILYSASIRVLGIPHQLAELRILDEFEKAFSYGKCLSLTEAKPLR